MPWSQVCRPHIPLVALNTHNVVSDSVHTTARALAIVTVCLSFLFVACSCSQPYSCDPCHGFRVRCHPMLSDSKHQAAAGGSGFLGRFLVQHLLATGEYASVKILDLNPPSPDIPGADFIKGNLTDVASVTSACEGIDVVFHTATAAPTAQNAASAQALMHAVNVQGTENVLAACGSAGVQRLVFTSSASVVFDGSPLVDVDESTPYADPPMDFYTHTKAQVGHCDFCTSKHMQPCMLSACLPHSGQPWQPSSPDFRLSTLQFQ